VRPGYRRDAAADRPFHRVIVQAAGNAVLLRLWDSLRFEVRTLEYRCCQQLDLRGFAEDHFRIVTALERGQGRTAGRLLKAHSLAVAAHVQRAPSSSRSA